MFRSKSMLPGTGPTYERGQSEEQVTGGGAAYEALRIRRHVAVVVGRQGYRWVLQRIEAVAAQILPEAAAHTLIAGDLRRAAVVDDAVPRLARPALVRGPLGIDLIVPPLPAALVPR